jgi:hypothetical protein
MIVLRASLEAALADIEAGTITGASTVVMSRSFWVQVPAREQDRYRERAAQAGVQLRADDAMSGHFVEVRDDVGPPLSTEHPT